MAQAARKTVLSSDMEAAMKRTNDIASEAVAAGQADRLAEVYTSDARILPPGAAMIGGRSGIIEFWRSAMAGGLKGVVLTTVDAMPAGDSVIEIGSADLTMATGPVTVKYVVVWKQEAGAWKWHVDIWNPNA